MLKAFWYRELIFPPALLAQQCPYGARSRHRLAEWCFSGSWSSLRGAWRAGRSWRGALAVRCLVPTLRARARASLRKAGRAVRELGERGAATARESAALSGGGTRTGSSPAGGRRVGLGCVDMSAAAGGARRQNPAGVAQRKGDTLPRRRLRAPGHGARRSTGRFSRDCSRRAPTPRRPQRRTARP